MTLRHHLTLFSSTHGKTTLEVVLSDAQLLQLQVIRIKDDAMTLLKVQFYLPCTKHHLVVHLDVRANYAIGNRRLGLSLES